MKTQSKISHSIIFALVTLSLLVNLAAFAKEKKPLFKSICPECGRIDIQAAKKVNTTGSASVNGGFRQQRTAQFKCAACKKLFTQHLVDRFVPAQPIAEEVRVPTKSKLSALSMPPMPPYPPK